MGVGGLGPLSSCQGGWTKGLFVPGPGRGVAQNWVLIMDEESPFRYLRPGARPKLSAALAMCIGKGMTDGPVPVLLVRESSCASFGFGSGSAVGRDLDPVLSWKSPYRVTVSTS